MDELKPCSKCGSEPKACCGTEGRGRNRRMVYGYNCSNPYCSWSYAWCAYPSLKEAAKWWNKKVEDAEYLKRESERLMPCTCGGKANLVFEGYGGPAGCWFVRCEKCQKLQTGVASMESAIESWNRM